MGMTIEFYAAEQKELIEIFSARDSTGDFTRFLEQLEFFPVADFSFHLHIPDDLDSMCQHLSKQDYRIPQLFNDILEKTLWNDDISESVTLLEHRFVSLLAEMSKYQIELAALEWAATFPYNVSLQETPAYQALLHLRDIAIDAITQKRSLLFHLDGIPAFFQW